MHRQFGTPFIQRRINNVFSAARERRIDVRVFHVFTLFVCISVLVLSREWSSRVCDYIVVIRMSSVRLNTEEERSPSPRQCLNIRESVCSQFLARGPFQLRKSVFCDARFIYILHWKLTPNFIFHSLLSSHFTEWSFFCILWCYSPINKRSVLIIVCTAQKLYLLHLHWCISILWVRRVESSKRKSELLCSLCVLQQFNLVIHE